MTVYINGTTGIDKVQDGVVQNTTLATGVPSKAKLPAGTVLQVASTTKTDTFTTTSVSYVDVTGLSVTITPSSTSSKIYVSFHVTCGISGWAGGLQLWRNSTPIAVGDAVTTNRYTCNVYNGGVDTNSMFTRSMAILDTPNTVSPVTYSVKVGCVQGGGTIVINDMTSQARGPSYAGTAPSNITIMEIAA